MPASLFMRLRRTLVLSAMLVAGAVACSENPTQPSSASRMESVSGDDQPGFAGIALEERLVVRVLDINNAPVPDQSVVWSVSSGGGSVAPTQTKTDDEGIARTTWTLGPMAGTQMAMANINGVDPVSFSAVATELGETCSGSPLDLPVGGSAVLLGSQAALLCLESSVASTRDFVVVAFNSTRVSSGSIGLQVKGSGVVGIVGPPSPSPDGQQGIMLSGQQEQEPSRDTQFESRLRGIELNELAPRVRAIPLSTQPQAPDLQPLFSLTNPIIGEVITLNAQPNSACTNPINRPGRIVAISQRAIVIADQDNPAGGFTDAEYQSIAATFDTLVYPLDVANFGEPEDIDHNNRVVLFYTREVNKITASGSPNGFVAGFFFARDLFPKGTGHPRLGACANSNESEIMYLMVPDPNGTINGNQRSKSLVMRRTISTLAHEMQHLINASRRLYVNIGAKYPERAWVEEGLAHIAEELLFFRASGLGTGQNITAGMIQSSQVAINAFNDHQADNVARLQDYLQNTNINWPFKTGSPDLETRGASTWYFRYIADRMGGQQSVTWRALVNSADTGMRNVEGVIQADPIQWMRDWAVSLYVDDAVNGIASRFRIPTWHMRSVAGALGSGSTYALRPPVLLNTVTRSATLLPGGILYYRMGIPGGGEGRLEVTASTNESALSVVVVRTR